MLREYPFTTGKVGIVTREYHTPPGEGNVRFPYAQEGGKNEKWGKSTVVFVVGGGSKEPAYRRRFFAGGMA